MRQMFFGAVFPSRILTILILAGCSRQVENTPSHRAEDQQSEAASLGELTAIAPGVIDAIILGDPETAAKSLLKATYDEKGALASVPLLLARLGECGEPMDEAILGGEDGQPIWMRMYSNWYSYSIALSNRRQQILLRLADCIREAEPSRERATARNALFEELRSRFLEEVEVNIEIARRSVVFVHPSGVVIESHAGWEELFDLYDILVASLGPVEEVYGPVLETRSEHQLSSVAGVYFRYCDLFPARRAEVLSRYAPASLLVQKVETMLRRSEEAAKRGMPTAVSCTEERYRTILGSSLPEWIEMYAGADHQGGTRILECLLTNTRQARLESFPLVKPYLETFKESPQTYYHWASLLRGYCVPVPEDANSEEIERQDWLLDELIGQIEENFLGDFKFGTAPARLLRIMVIPVGPEDCIGAKRAVPNPYGLKRIVQALVDGAFSNEQYAALAALKELDVLNRFDLATAMNIKEQLEAQKHRIRTNAYPEKVGRPTKDDLYSAVEDSIKSAEHAIGKHKTLKSGPARPN